MNRSARIVVFELRGRMAHFRKIDANSSSLTYLIPPRTTLSGMIAAILGLERDSYYELLGPARSWITVSLRTNVRTVMQTMNNLLVKSPSELAGASGHTQVPTELVVPQAADGWVVYRVFFAHQDESLVEEVAERVARRSPAFPISLGTAPMLAEIHPLAVVAGDALHCVPVGHDAELVTPCLVEDVERLIPASPTSTWTEVVKDLMPYSFGPRRSDGWNREFLYERQGLPLAVRLRCASLRVEYGTGLDQPSPDTIVFTEKREFPS